ncbi:MAG: hypothetical protein JW996_02740 [Candidatus Cloacimonetes bacterium]|nr:hypothetical protein [Candidatus Cloacimonadota bacterium]
MNNLIERYFTQKSSLKKIEFTRLLSQRRLLQVIFTDSVYTNYQLLQKIASWKDMFSKFRFFFTDFDYSFFSRLTSFTDLETHRFSDTLKSSTESIIVNFSDHPGIRKHLNRCRNSLILDIDNSGNFQFHPQDSTPLKILENFAGFAQLPYQNGILNFKFLDKDAKEARFNFFQNKFLNIILDIHNPGIFKSLENLIVSLKQNFPANIYITGRQLKKNWFINTRNLETGNMLDLFFLSRESDILLCDQQDRVKVFSNFDINQIFLSKTERMTGIESVDPGNIELIKEQIDRKVKGSVKEG